MADHTERRQAVRNAADPRQVKEAGRLDRRRVERYQNALRAVMSTTEGRIVMAALVRRAGVFKSIWHPSAEIHYNAGKQDYGHELMADLYAIDDGTAYQVMEREEWAYGKALDREIDAIHTARRSDDTQGERE